MITFTVIIPCYNTAATLTETLESLSAQTFPDWEAILVDDGSTDATAKMIAEACSQDSRLRGLFLANGGPSVARNAAAALARGRYLAFLDADDLWLPTKLAETKAAFEGPAAPYAVFGKIGFFHTSELPDHTTSTVAGGFVSLQDALGENPVCTLSNLSVRHDTFLALGGFDEAFRFAEDLEFQLRLLGSGAGLWGIDSLHVRYRASETGLSANLMKMHDGWRRAVMSAQASGAPIKPADILRAEAIHLRYLSRRALRMRARPSLATCLALRGFIASPRAFLSNPYRGAATLCGCLAAPLLPRTIRDRLFA